MNFIKDKLENFLLLSSLDNIIANYPKTMGVVCNLTNCPNDNGRYVGRLILTYNSNKKLMLNEVVEFLEYKKQWQSVIKENTQMYLVDPFFVRKYIPNPTIECLVEVLDPKKNIVQYSTMNLKYKQFMKRRLLEKTGMWPYRLVEAVENFNKMLKYGKYKAINSTVKNYLVTQEELESHIGKRATVIRDINREWDKLVAHHNSTKDM